MQKGEDSGQSDKQSAIGKRPPIWDCGSSLYDSFELKSFEKQLDSAISSRTLSMPHLPDDRRLQPEEAAAARHRISNNRASKLSRSFQKLLRSVFRPKQNKSGEGFYVAYDTSSTLSTIPEAPEFDGLSPEIRSLVRRTASDRFMTTPIGIYCV